MERLKKEDQPLSRQMERHAKTKPKKEEELKGNFNLIISTGSTLLDLAISGKRIRGGGLPGGIVVEAFGPSQSGKTALLSEIAGAVQRKGGDALFHDPEARLDNEFAAMFGMHIPEEKYFQPDTVTEVFKESRKWIPDNTNYDEVVNGIFADSLAALSTKMEMEEEDGDKMGMRRAKEFSEQLRKFCRIINKKNYLMVCSNQVRVNMDGQNKYSPKYTVPGGLAFSFYASVRLKFGTPSKIYKEITFNGKKIKEVVGIEVEIEVIKTVDSPYRKAPIYIMYDYGIDDIRGNLQYIKDHTKNTTFMVGDRKLDPSLEKSVKMVEHYNLEKELKNEVIDLWQAIQDELKVERKSRHGEGN
jgi:protein RecA